MIIKQKFRCIIFIVMLSCNDEPFEPSIPLISIISHQNGDTVTEIDTIIVSSSNYNNTKKIDFFIDELLVVTDREPPYEYIWNTLTYQDLVEYFIIAKSYDNNSDVTSSDTISLTVDNRINLWGNLYSRDTTEVILPARSLTGSIPPQIIHLKELTILDLSSNLLSGKFPDELWTLTSLTVLDLHGNNLSDTIPPEIKYLNNLSELYLYDNYLLGFIPEELGLLTSLFELRLKNNEFEGIVPEAICDLENLFLFNALGETNFSNNKLCPPYPGCIDEYLGTQHTENCD